MNRAFDGQNASGNCSLLRKNKRIVKAACIFMALLLIVPAFCGCNNGEGKGGRATDQVTQEPTPEPTPEKRYTSMQLFDDVEFRNGFTVIGQNTVKKGNVYIDPANPEGTGTKPSWMIAQWNSGPCLYRDRVESAPNIVTDGTVKTVTFNPEDRSVSLRLNTIPLYDGKPGVTENWPHLLLEQSPLNISPNKSSDADRLPYYSCSCDKMIVSLDIRMTDYKFVFVEGVNAAQFLSYYYIKSKTGNDFVWFGVPLFDNRGETGIYWAIDTAGSDRMIYSIASTDTYKNSPHSLLNEAGEPIVSDEWVHVEVDIRPHIEALLERGLKEGTFKSAKTLDDLYIAGVNIGWETIGSFDIDVQIRDFKLTGYIEEK
ncbi:MAG: hypothetical protein IKH41_00945 [Clostridia bacterium]|nr:hypothetical protein [Clostridia bacterium]